MSAQQQADSDEPRVEAWTDNDGWLVLQEPDAPETVIQSDLGVTLEDCR